MSRLLSFTAPLLGVITATIVAGCIPDTNGSAPNPQLQTKVGNNDPRGVDDQPNWDQQASELKHKVEPRMPNPMPTDKRAVCTAMLDEAVAFYTSIETVEDQRAARLAQLEGTRTEDLEACVRDTSIAAAVCVTLLLSDRDSEFPWLLDQCSRAYPTTTITGAVEPDKAEAIELTFVGDIIFGRYRDDNIFDPIVDPSKIKPDEPLAGPFAELEPQLKSDLLIGNLETPVIEILPIKSPIGSKFRFGGGRTDVEMLHAAGFGVLSLANNHYFDLREDGQVQTPIVLADVGIVPIGASRTDEPLYRVETVTVNGWKIGFLSVTNRVNAPVRANTPQVPYIELTDMVDVLGPLITAARPDHDLLIVAVHWGDEYAEAPTIYHEKAAHGLIDAGLDMLVGHHPHVLQGIEHYKHGLIAYSMGNFLFEHTGAIPRLTGVLRTRFTQAGDAELCLADVVFHSAYVKRSPYPHPTVATGALGNQVRNRVVSQGKALGSTFVPIDGTEDLRLDGLTCPG